MRRLIRDLYVICDGSGRSFNGMSPNQATAVLASALACCVALGAAPACGSSDPKRAVAPRHSYADGGQLGEGGNSHAASAGTGDGADSGRGTMDGSPGGSDSGPGGSDGGLGSEWRDALPHAQVSACPA